MRQTFTGLIASAVLSLAVSALALGVGGRPASAAKTVANSRAQALRAVNIIRVINTAEVSACRSRDGGGDSAGFRSWTHLVNAPCFKRAQADFRGKRFAQDGKLSFSAAPEITPGLVLRLVVSPDGKHYNLWLGQKPDVRCGFAFYSDERGVIYEGKAIGCSVQGVVGIQ
jgi:hypothetical protein